MANKEFVLLGIDIGTSSCKLTVFTLDGKVLISENEKYPTYYPQKNWVEQKPDEWWESVCLATKRIMSNPLMKDKELKGIGVDGQGWSMIPIDSEGNVLFNNPIWLDNRAIDICEEIKERIGEDEIFDVSANPFESTYTLPKVLWLKKHHPDIYTQVDYILQANSYIVYKLTNHISQDISQAYAYHCFNMKKGEWDQEMADRLGISLDVLPPIVNCDEVVGYVTEKTTEETGLPQGVAVVAGGLDAACGALGAGVIADGETQEQGGQAEGMSICLQEYAADKRLIMGYHVVPNYFLLQGGTVGGGGVIDWVKNNFCYEEKVNAEFYGTDAYYEMDQLSASVSPGSDGVVFLPYMKGERSPIWNPEAKGLYFGLQFTKTRAHIIRSSQEGVAYSLKHNLEIAEAAGATVKELWSVGGSANSEVFMQIKADITGKVIKVPSADTATTLGAAILAGVGTGLYKDYTDARKRTLTVEKTYYPNEENQDIYEKGFKRYLSLYEKLEPLMTEEGVS